MSILLAAAYVEIAVWVFIAAAVLLVLCSFYCVAHAVARRAAPLFRRVREALETSHVPPADATEHEPSADPHRNAPSKTEWAFASVADLLAAEPWNRALKKNCLVVQVPDGDGNSQQVRWDGDWLFAPLLALDDVASMPDRLPLQAPPGFALDLDVDQNSREFCLCAPVPRGLKPADVAGLLKRAAGCALAFRREHGLI